MGQILETVETIKETIKRCKLIIINSTYGKMQTITQKYENVVLLNDEYLTSSDAETFTTDMSYLQGISTVINGKTITSDDVIAFILWFNDNRQEAIEQVHPKEDPITP